MTRENPPLSTTIITHDGPEPEEVRFSIPAVPQRTSMDRRGWITKCAVLFLIFFAFAASISVSRNVFENVPHLEDEVAYLFQAKIFARGQFTVPIEHPKSAFWQPFVIDHENGQRFSKYPPGWSMLLAMGVMLGFPAVVNAVLAALTVVMTYRLGREAFNRETGVTAAALVAFSPMALLLNATLMAHTAALFCATLFMWSYVRMTSSQGRHPLIWGAVAGSALGFMTATRPLSAVAVALPFIVWSGIAVVRAASSVPMQSTGPSRTDRIRRTLLPLVMLSIFALLAAGLVPLYNAATTGDARANLYTLVPGWDYDRVGFGPDIGRNGHTLTKGVQFARFDLSLTAADLFGWQLSGWTDMLTAWVNGVAPTGMVADSYWPAMGLSWVLLPFGLIAGFRREWAAVWVIGGVLWLSLAGTFLLTGVEWWSLAGIVWALLPLAIFSFRGTSIGKEEAGTTAQIRTWLLFGVLFSLIAVHTAYWIGSQRYSTRYYAEGLSAAALLSALPLAWLMRQGKAWRLVVITGLIAALTWSYFGYSIPRISALRGYNRVTREVIYGVLERQAGDRPVLVLVSGTDARWRTRAALWTIGSPYLDSEFEVVFVDTTLENARESVLMRLPGRQIIDMGADVHDVWFMDTCTEAGCTLANPPVNPTLLAQGAGR